MTVDRKNGRLEFTKPDNLEPFEDEVFQEDYDEYYVIVYLKAEKVYDLNFHVEAFHKPKSFPVVAIVVIVIVCCWCFLLLIVLCIFACQNENSTPYKVTICLTCGIFWCARKCVLILIRRKYNKKEQVKAEKIEEHKRVGEQIKLSQAEKDKDDIIAWQKSLLRKIQHKSKKKMSNRQSK